MAPRHAFALALLVAMLAFAGMHAYASLENQNDALARIEQRQKDYDAERAQMSADYRKYLNALPR